jgi:acetate kinase
MHILVANLGSTSFKYRLFDMTSESQLARGGVERIGAPESRCFAEVTGQRFEEVRHVPDHAEAVRQCLAQLTDPERGCLKDAREVAAIGFKAVHGGRISGVQRVTADVLSAMEEMAEVAPAHNPPYIRAMRLLMEKLPEIPLVAAFETDFHSTIPERNRYYAIPYEWTNWGVRCWGFHGASHRYIATRTAEVLGRRDLRIISCHLGGSSSVCAIRDGQSVFTSMDLRDIMQAANEGNWRAQLAVDVFVASIRKYLGGSLVELGGADVLVFTGGIGENQPAIRTAVCRGLGELGIVLDDTKNQQARGEAEIGHETSRTRIWVIPTNEELIVARQAKALLESGR